MKGIMQQAAAGQSGEAPAARRSGFRVGGVSVDVVGTCENDVALVPSLEPFWAHISTPDISIRVEWVGRIPASVGRECFDSGTTWRLYEGAAEFQFDLSVPVGGERPCKRLVVDHRFRRARLQLSEDSFAGFPRAVYPFDYPLDELLIMHRLTQERAIELHGVGIVGPEGASNLFVGHSGAGKSTTARLWTSLHNVEILSDDRIIVREHSVPENNVRESKATEGASQIYMYGTPWHGEAAFALPDRAPLQRIFVLEHGSGNVLTRLTRSQAVAELFARSFVPFHRHEYVDNALSFLEHVADSIPCYRYAFEPDQRAVEKILQFND